MEDLPHDVLAHVLLDSPPALNDKLAISAVSRRLRRVVLDMPLLWSSIEIHAGRDLLWLEAFVARSRNALLDVTVYPDGDGDTTDAMWVRPYQRNVDKVTVALLPHVARFRSFSVYLYDLSMAPFLDANLVFDRLAELVVHGSCPREPFPISLTAPELEVVDLRAVYVRDWSSIMTARLKHLSVVHLGTTTQPFMDQLFRNSTKTLRRLVLMDSEIVHDTTPLKGLWMFPHLEYLELLFTLNRTLDILQALPTAHIHHVSLFLQFGDVFQLAHRNDPHPIFAHLLDGVGEIAAFARTNTYTFTLVTSSGQRRDLRRAAASETALLAMWRYLCRQHNAHKSITSCEIEANVWSWYRVAFCEYPPAGPGFVLRLSVKHIHPVTSILEFPTLAKVVLIDVGRSEADLNRLIRWLAKDTIKCVRSKVPLCICACVQGNTYIRDALEEGLRGISAGRSKSADASSETRWFLCPGNC